jgi:hypothetical protein
MSNFLLYARRDKPSLSYATGWARGRLDTLGIHSLSAATIFRERPWSTVLRIETSAGILFLKVPVPGLAKDAAVIELLATISPGLVPEVLAKDEETGCFLMRDAGEPLHDFLQQQINAAKVAEVLRSYAEMQIAASGRLQELFELGLPDWRLDRFPEVYAEFLSSGILQEAEGVDDEELFRFKSLSSAIAGICSELLSLTIPSSIEHADFHDKNIMISDAGAVRIIDFGDAVVTHPFFSAANFLYKMQRNHASKVSPEIMALLEESYLSPWRKDYSAAKCAECMRLVKTLNDVRYVLSYGRLLRSLPDISEVVDGGRMALILRDFQDRRSK